MIENIVSDWNTELIEKFFQESYDKVECDGKILEKFSLTDILRGIERGDFKSSKYLDINPQTPSTIPYFSGLLGILQKAPLVP